MAKKGQNQVPGMVSGGSKAKKPAKGRVSVAAARKSKGDRTQLIIGGVAILVIIAVIVIGVVMNAKSSATQGDGYGVSTESTATIDDAGVITVAVGNPELSLDVYEDALCPLCADFEHQYGQQMAQALDQGQLELKFRMVDFLNRHSASGDYSTRAYAALQTVAKVDGDKKGVFMAFHTAIYDAKNQPKENGSTDLSNDDLADIAGDAGASDEAQQQIKDGAFVDAATADAQTNLALLTETNAKVGRGAGTPTVAKDGVPLSTGTTSWLTDLLPAAPETSEESGK